MVLILLISGHPLSVRLGRLVESFDYTTTLLNIVVDFWYFPDPQQLVMAYSLRHARFTIRNPNIFHLVCTRIPTLAREQRAVWLFAKQFYFFSIDYISSLGKTRLSRRWRTTTLTVMRTLLYPYTI